jgi:acetoin utilization protein AcuB
MSPSRGASSRRPKRRAAIDRPRELPLWLDPVPIATWMRSPVVTIGPRTAVAEAAELMKRQGIRHLPVVEPSGRLVGIVTDRDLRQVIFDPAIQERVEMSAEALRTLTAQEIMTWGVITVRPDCDIRQAAAVMHEGKIGALPVVDGGRVVGMLTEHDVLRALQDLLRERVRRVRPLAPPARSEELDEYAVEIPEANLEIEAGEGD